MAIGRQDYEERKERKIETASGKRGMVTAGLRKETGKKASL